MRIGYTQTESDLEIVSNIITETDLSKKQIKSVVTKDSIYEYLNFKKDTVELQNAKLIFNGEKLSKVLRNY